ncbi:MAG: 2-amino-4-hydroxy-6-hydroxymethyldihydropteridine diphosphokinase [Bacteroidota bacterium]
MIWIGLGTNQGDRVGYMVQAVREIQKYGYHLCQLSSLYETAPWGIEDQPSFLNAVAILEKKEDPLVLLDDLLEIEKEMGRIRVQKWGPRIIDLDIIDFQGEKWDHPRLKLPHPFAHTRSFVLAPMAELAPDYCLGKQEKTVQEWLKELPEQSFTLHQDTSWAQVQRTIRNRS